MSNKPPKQSCALNTNTTVHFLSNWLGCHQKESGTRVFMPGWFCQHGLVFSSVIIQMNWWLVKICQGEVLQILRICWVLSQVTMNGKYTLMCSNSSSYCRLETEFDKWVISSEEIRLFRRRYWIMSSIYSKTVHFFVLHTPEPLSYRHTKPTISATRFVAFFKLEVILTLWVRSSSVSIFRGTKSLALILNI